MEVDGKVEGKEKVFRGIHRMEKGVGGGTGLKQGKL